MNPRPASSGVGAGPAAIEARGLCVRFGSKLAVAGADFTVASGEVYGFLGPNGAGKTTTLRLLLGLQRPSEGRARVLGFDPEAQALALRARTGYVSQLHSLYGDLTVAQNLDFFGRLYGLERERLRRRVGDEIERFRLEDSRSRLAGQLPTGVARRAALAAALLHEPELLVLDEPTSGMDTTARREFWTFLGGLSGGGVTVVITTHHLEEVEGCDRLAVMLNGRVRFEGTPGAFRETFGGPLLRVRADPWQEAFLALKRAYGASLFGTEIAVEPGKASAEEVLRLLSERGIAAVSVEERPPSYEDAFLRAAEQALAERGEQRP